MSQDYFLSKVYMSVKDKTAEKTSKPQNLKQAYHKVILEQINEDTDILMQSRNTEGIPTGDVEEYRISDELAKQIKSSIKKETMFSATEGKTNIPQIITKVLTSANWNKTSNFNLLVETVSNVFNKEELVVDSFVKYPELITTAKNLIQEKLINSSLTKVNLKDLIPSWFYGFFETPEAGLRVIESLWGVVPNTKPASGSGELVLTLVSSTQKAPQGDLRIGDLLVELKGSGGTMGGDGHVYSISSELQQILTDDLTGVSMANRKKEVISRIQNEFAAKHDQSKKDIIQQIEKDAPFDVVKKVIDQSTLTDKDKEKVYSLLVAGLTIPKVNFRDSLLAFFSKYEALTDEQLAAGIFASRNYRVISNPDIVKTKIKNIVSTEKNSLFQKNYERRFTYELAGLIAAFHICAYQEAEKFKGIIFANDKTKDMVYLNFSGNTVAENLERVYNFIKQFKPTISLSMTQIQKAAGFPSFFSK